jgi:RNA polymerase sigma-70 factor, ECF subfamily
MTAGETPPTFRDAIIRTMPNLRAFAISLCGNPHMANDLVQETLLKAWSHRDAFVPGTNHKAWLFTILRNTYFSGLRKSRREVADIDGDAAARLVTLPDQITHLEFKDFQKALAGLSADQREALLLVGAEGFSYEEAAIVAGCAVGTVKSRVNRARQRLAAELGLDLQRRPGELESLVPQIDASIGSLLSNS